MNDHEGFLGWLGQRPADLSIPRAILPEPGYDTHGAPNRLSLLPADVVMIARTARFACPPTAHPWAQLNLCLRGPAGVIVEGETAILEMVTGRGWPGYERRI